eukprot:scaffold30697_cov28-Tisochrysis_lutea.AAC.2
MTDPANEPMASSRERSVSTSRSLVGSSSKSKLQPIRSVLAKWTRPRSPVGKCRSGSGGLYGGSGAWAPSVQCHSCGAIAPPERLPTSFSCVVPRRLKVATYARMATCTRRQWGSGVSSTRTGPGRARSEDRAGDAVVGRPTSRSPSVNTSRPWEISS